MCRQKTTARQVIRPFHVDLFMGDFFAWGGGGGGVVDVVKNVALINGNRFIHRDNSIAIDHFCFNLYTYKPCIIIEFIMS